MSKKVKLGVEVDGIDDVSKNIQEAEKSAGNLRKEFREARNEVERLAAADVINQDELDEAITKMAEIKDELNDINEEVNIFASGSKYEVVSNAFGSIGRSLMSLDFAKAEQRAQTFARAASAITFGDAVKSLRQLGSTFITLGKSLLTNPLFLIGAVIAGIAVAIVKVLDNLGVLKTITEAVGQVFDGVLKTIENLILRVTDFFGLTSKDARDAAEALDEQAEATRRAAQEINDKNSDEIRDIDQKIRMAKIQGENTEELQRRKLLLLSETAQAQKKLAEDELEAAEASNNATEEEIKKLQDRVNENKIAFNQTLNDYDAFETELVVRRKAAADKEITDRRATNERLRAERERVAAEEEKMRIDTQKRIEDLRLQNLEDGVEKELEINRVKYDRLIEETKNNEKLLDSERQAIIDELEIQRQAAEKDIRDQELEKVREQEVAKQDILNEFKERALEDEQLEIFQEELRFQEENERLRLALEQEVLTEQEFYNLKEQLEQEHKNELEKINDDYRDREKEQEQLLQQQKLQIASLGFQSIGNLASLFADSNEKNAKRAFNIQKAAGIAGAAVDTFKSATAAYASQLIPGDPTSVIRAGIAAAAATTAGLANINAIRKQRFETGSISETPQTPSPTLESAETAPTPPSLFGDEIIGSEIRQEGEAGIRQGGAVRAIVVESEISDTQQRLSTFRNRSEIG